MAIVLLVNFRICQISASLIEKDTSLFKVLNSAISFNEGSFLKH